MAHEMGHNLERQHAPSDTTWNNPACQVPGNPDNGYPHYLSPFGTPYHRCSIGHVGVNPLTATTFNPLTNYDFMGYCWPRWVSPYTWDALFYGINTLPTRPASATTVMSPHVLVSGRVDGDGEVSLRPSRVRDLLEGSHGEAGAGPYVIELEGAAGQTLFARRFDVTDPYAGSDSSPGRFREWLPYPPGVARIVVRDDDELAATTVSPNPPAVSLITPTGGEVWDGDAPRLIAWHAEDADGGPLSANVLYSRDDGATWQIVTAGVTDEQVEVLPSWFAGSAHAAVAVEVTDGVNTTLVRTGAPILVPNKPPVVIVLEGGPGTVGEGTTARLAAVATDPEDGPIPAESIVWSSSVDGELGTGGDLHAASLSCGEHAITATVWDSQDAPGSAEMPLTSCCYEVGRESIVFDAPGGGASVTLTCSSATCGWKATSGADWLRVTGPTSGTGAATIIVSAAPNRSSTLRATTLSIGDKTVEVIQERRLARPRPHLR
jgi:hypothetical protein